MTESRPENSKASCARGTGALLQIWEETWFLSRVFVPICGTRPPDHSLMATETQCHNRKARICEAQAGVFARGGRDVRRVQGGTTGPETSAHPLRALGTSSRLVQPFPPWHSCLSLGNPPSVTGKDTSLLYASFSTARFSLTRKDRLVFKGVQFLGKLLEGVPKSRVILKTPSRIPIMVFIVLHVCTDKLESPTLGIVQLSSSQADNQLASLLSHIFSVKMK